MVDRPDLPAVLAASPSFSALAALADRLTGVDLTPLLVYLVDTAPASVLDVLAEQFSLVGDGWELADTESDRRALIRRSIELHRHKGAVWAVEQALAAIGCEGSELVEHNVLHAKWRAAGGELLDGGGQIDGGGNLAAPDGDFRFATVHWAEYALRLNTGDAAWSAARSRQIAATCRAYAPARSRLAAIILSARHSFDATVRLGNMTARGAMRLVDCRRISVPRFDVLDGCDLIGGESLPDAIDGIGALDDGLLDGVRLSGEPLDGGQLGFSARGRASFTSSVSGGSRLEAPEPLDGGSYLDGRYTLSGPLLDGYGTLDGAGDLFYPTLLTPDDTLDGTSNLGGQEGVDHLWFSGSIRIRRGPQVFQETLQ